MKKVTIDSLRKATEGGAKVVDKDGLDVRFPKVEEKPEPPPPQVEKQSETQPIVDSLDKLAQALAKVLKANLATADSVAAALSVLTEQKSEPRYEPRPPSYDVAIKRDKDGKMKSLFISPSE